MRWKMTFKFGRFEILEFILCFTAKLCGLYGTQENTTLNPLTHFLIKNVLLFLLYTDCN